MTHAPNWMPSKRLQAAAKSERKRMERELERLRKQEARHRRELARIESTRAQLQAELVAVDRFVSSEAPERPRLRVVDNESELSRQTPLKGAQIREFAVQLIVGTEHATKGIHYRTWYELVASNGIEIAGKDPVATFLTQMSRSPVVVKKDQAGVYAIDEVFPERASREISKLESEIAKLEAIDKTLSVEEIEERRKREKEAKTRMRVLLRETQEAKRSLENRHWAQ